MPAPNNIPQGSILLDQDLRGKQRYQMPNGQIFVIWGDGQIETEPGTHREVTLYARAYHPVTGAVINGQVVGKSKVKYGPPPNYSLPLALVYEGKAYEKHSDDMFRAVE